MSVRQVALLALVVVMGWTGTVAADAIGMPPSCPPGSLGRTSHAGQRCVPLPCEGSDACDSDRAHECRRWRVCTQTFSVPPAGRGAVRGGAPHDEELVVATCAPEAGCTGTEEPPPPTVGTARGRPRCRVETLCVPDTLPSLPRGLDTGRSDEPPSLASDAPEGSSPSSPTSEPSGIRWPIEVPLYEDPDAAATGDEGCGCRASGRGRAPAGFGAMAFALWLARRRRA